MIIKFYILWTILSFPFLPFAYAKERRRRRMPGGSLINKFQSKIVISYEPPGCPSFLFNKKRKREGRTREHEAEDQEFVDTILISSSSVPFPRQFHRQYKKKRQTVKYSRGDSSLFIGGETRGHGRDFDSRVHGQPSNSPQLRFLSNRSSSMRTRVITTQDASW